MNEEDIEASCLEVDALRNAADSLFRAEEHIGRVEEDRLHWKWVIICLQHSLYTFALKFAAGSNAHAVMKRGRVFNFVEALNKCFGAERFCHSVPFEPTRGQKNSLLWLHDHFRNGLEHFSPNHTWGIPLHGLPNMCVDALEIIRFLALDSRNIIIGEEAERNKIRESIEKSIRMLRLSSFYLPNENILEHPKLAVSRASFSIVCGGSNVGVLSSVEPLQQTFEKLFEAVSRRLNGKDVKVDVKIDSAGTGSVGGCIELTRNSDGRPVEFLLGREVADARRLVEFVFGRGWLISLIRRVGRRVPEVEKADEYRDQFTVNGESFEVDARLSKLYKDIEVCKALGDLVGELFKRRDIERFDVRVKDDSSGVCEPAEPVSKSEAGYFYLKKGSDGKEVLEFVWRAVFHVESLSFEENDKWELKDGNTRIKVLMADRKFLRRVGSNEVSFAKGDVLECRVRTVCKLGSRDEHMVESVIDHRPSNV